MKLWEPDAIGLKNGASVGVAVARDDSEQVVMQSELNAHPEEMRRRSDNLFEPD